MNDCVRGKCLTAILCNKCSVKRFGNGLLVILFALTGQSLSSVFTSFSGIFSTGFSGRILHLHVLLVVFDD